MTHTIQKDKYEMLKMLAKEIDQYHCCTADLVDHILKVWPVWISEHDSSEILSRQEKKNWKKRENKMKALLAAIAGKHALRKE